MIAGFSHRSIGIQNGKQEEGIENVSNDYDEGIKLASGVIVTRENAHASGMGEIFDR